MAETPLRNKDNDLVSVIYHVGQGVQSCSQYAPDAKEDGDKEAAAFFAEVEGE